MGNVLILHSKEFNETYFANVGKNGFDLIKCKRALMGKIISTLKQKKYSRNDIYSNIVTLERFSNWQTFEFDYIKNLYHSKYLNLNDQDFWFNYYKDNRKNYNYLHNSNTNIVASYRPYLY
jgi:hypothetical protein